MKHGLLRVSAMTAGLLLSLSPLALAGSGDGHGPCSIKTLNGTYGFYRAGTIQQGAGGLSAVGWLSYDGNGNGAFVQSISKNGDYSYDVDGTFTYTLDSDCQGKGFLDGEEFVRFVVVDGGRELYMFSESTDNAVYGVGKKIKGD